ncbi:MAG: hypothetical protein NZM38_01500 [Cytophagales bacterium]|nr:hypothetical protein [Cytophagales bacterium]MDW8383426.1 hypothetical protein [Flammeovirgaceae bacterium]
MKLQNVAALLLGTLLLYACSSSQQQENTTTTATDSAKITPSKPRAELIKKWETDTVLTTCESVLYDEASALLYVSNINGAPLEKNKKGFISRLKTDGSIENLYWVKGLNAPKGMGILDGKLYVTDIDELVEIDIQKAKVLKKYPVKGAKFLNDITVDANGKVVYFSDMENNKIHTFKNGKVEEFLSDTTLGKVNGLHFEVDRIVFATFGDAKLKAVDLSTKKVSILADGIETGDGIADIERDVYLVSGWNGEVYFFEKGSLTKLLDTKEAKINAADIEYITTNKLLLVPTFFKNTVAAYELVINNNQ